MLTLHESPTAQAAAAEAILQLASHDPNRWQVAHNAGLPALVGLLGVEGAATPAVLAIAQMAENKTYHEAIADVCVALVWMWCWSDCGCCVVGSDGCVCGWAQLLLLWVTFVSIV